MLYHLFNTLRDDYSVLNLFKYITVRTFFALITAMLIYFLLGLKWIRFLKARQYGQIIRTDGPATHLQKKNTPTMGGLLVNFSILVSVLLWCDLKNSFVIVSTLVMAGFSLIGFVDDYIKIIRKNSNGFRGHYKIVLEVAISLAAALYFYGNGQLDTNLYFPFFKGVSFDIGVFYLFFAVFIIAGSANAVNITDGLDGLVTVPAITSFFSFGILSYAAGNAVIANYLMVTFVPGVGELSVVCGAMIGALIAFLWYNTHPAEIFMGDVGALGIGALLGMVALATKNEILLGLIGGIFVLETVSVIIQVLSFKMTGRRVFQMAPLHHHFELKGWKESKIIVRFWIVAFILALLSLVTLKIR